MGADATLNTTVVADALARLVDGLVANQPFNDLVTLYTSEYQNLENTFYDIYTKFRIGTAANEELDILGKIVGEDRNGKGDAEYTLYINARIAANLSGGDVESILRCLVLILDDTTGTVEVKQLFPAALCVTVKNIAIVESVATAMSAFLADCRIAGVRGLFKFNTSIPESSFRTVDHVLFLDGTFPAGDVEVDIQTLPGMVFPQSGRALIDAGTFVEETSTYVLPSNDLPPHLSLLIRGIVNELGQPGLRFAHGDRASIALLPDNDWTVTKRSAVVWENLVNVTATGNDLEKTGGSVFTWDAGATSIESIADGADGAVEFEVNNVADFVSCGLSVGNTDADQTDIGFAFYVNGSIGDMQVRENGAKKYTHSANIDVGDVCRVQRAGTEITYWLNGAKIATSPSASTGELIVDCSLFSGGYKILNAFVEQTTQNTELVRGFVGKRYKVEWENIVNCDTEVNDLTKNNAAGWNAGASSIQKSGLDCAVEFTTGLTTDTLVGGLGEVNVDAVNTDVEYGFYCRTTIDVKVMENGTVKYTHPSYVFVPGDVARVQRVGTEITYWYNGEKIYTSAIADPGNDLYFDSSIFSAAGKIVNATFIALDDDGESEQQGGTLATAKES